MNIKDVKIKELWNIISNRAKESGKVTLSKARPWELKSNIEGIQAILDEIKDRTGYNEIKEDKND